MAVDSVTLSTTSVPEVELPTKPVTLSDDESSTKIDPNDEEEVMEAGLEILTTGMISNMLLMNNSLFNFAKEAIDEADAE